MFKYLVYPFTLIYYLLSKLNKYLTKSKKLYKPVISIGNITWGGSGKTPMVIEVAKYILNIYTYIEYKYLRNNFYFPSFYSILFLFFV